VTMQALYSRLRKAHATTKGRAGQPRLGRLRLDVTILGECTKSDRH
jgi:hypothetical protein